MNYLTLGQKLRLKRKELNLTLKDVTSEYISPATLSLVERDLQVPSDDLLRYLAEKLQTPFHYFRETPEETLNRRAKTLLAEAEALMYRGRHGMAVRFAEEILIDAQELKCADLVGHSALLLARINLKQGDFSRANHFLFLAQSATLTSGHHELLPSIYYCFGMGSYLQGYFQQALDYLLQAKTFDRENRDDELRRKILSGLTQTCQRMGRFDDALAYALEAKELVSRMNDLEAYAESLILLGASYREKEQYDTAQGLFNEALRLIRQMNSLQGQSDVEQNLAALYVKTGELAKADEHFKLAIAQKEELGDPTVVGVSLDHIEMLIEGGDTTQAQVRLGHTLDLLEIYPAEQERARALALQFHLHRMLGDEEASREALEASLQIVRRQPMPRRMADTLVRLGRICASSGDTAAASVLYTEALTVYEKLGVILNHVIMV